MAIERSIDSAMRGRSNSRDAMVAALAARQHGVVARWQLLARDLSRDVIDRGVARGRLHVVHSGVYAVGHRVLSRNARWMAAVLAGGPGAGLSHRAAASLWSVRGGFALEITTPRLCRRPGIIAHRATLPADEVTTRAGIPVTTIVRTIFDLAAVAPFHDVEAAANQAEYQQLADTLSLSDLAARYPNQRGLATIKRLIRDARIGRTMTRSELETAFLAFLDVHRLPRPDATNIFIEAGGRLHECDAVWYAPRLIVELDGPGHDTRQALHEDRTDDRALTVAGWRVVRVTERHLTTDQRQLAADLRALTAAAGSSRSG
jgi:hypothetical protein